MARLSIGFRVTAAAAAAAALSGAPIACRHSEATPIADAAPRAGDASPGAPSASAGAISAAPTADCMPPSVRRMHGADDSRDLSDLAQCSSSDPWRVAEQREQPLAARCGAMPNAPPIDLPRLLDAVAPIDESTRSHVRALFERGGAMGRRDNVFALIGDSTTVEVSFLRPFRANAPDRVVVSPAIRAALSTSDGRTIIDFFRGVDAFHVGARSVDSFGAPRAAQVGVRAAWANAPDAHQSTPISRIVDELSPAYAIVLLGTNDAADHVAALDEMSAEFTSELLKIVEALEQRGVIPILTTIPKHTRDWRFPDCPTATIQESNYRISIQTNALSFAVAEVACARHLPLIDFRYAMDPLLDRGVGKDGTHPTRYFGGGGVLDAAGLQCGYNVRNFLTLRMLELVHDAALTPGDRREPNPDNRPRAE